MALLQGVTNWLFRPAATADLSATPNAQRMGKYNELSTVEYYQDQYPACLEGSYYTASTGAPLATGVAIGTSLSAFASGSTAPAAIWINNNLPGGPVIELDYFKLIQTTGQLPTTSTSVKCAIALDLASIKMPTTAGTVCTPINCNTGASNASKALVQFGAIVTAADSSANVLVFQDNIEPTASTPCAIVGDMFMVKFGAPGLAGSTPAYQTATGAVGMLAKQVVTAGPPIIIPPGWAAVLKVWAVAIAAATAQTYGFETGWRER